MNCSTFVEFLAEYLSATLSVAERTAFEAHLAVCAACVAYLKNYQDTVQLGKAVFVDMDASLPAEVPQELVQAILAARQQSRP